MEKYEVMWSGGDGADYMQVDIDGDIVTVEVEPPFGQCITPEDEFVTYNELCKQLLQALDEYGIGEDQLEWPYPEGMEDVPCHQVCYEMGREDECDEDEEILYVVKVKPVEGVELKAQTTVCQEDETIWKQLEWELEQQAVLAGIPRSSFAFEDDWRYPDAIDDYEND